MEPFQNNESCFAVVERYRLVAKGMQRAVVYLESSVVSGKSGRFIAFLEGYGFYFFSLTPKKSAVMCDLFGFSGCVATNLLTLMRSNSYFTDPHKFSPSHSCRRPLFLARQQQAEVSWDDTA